MISLQHIAEAAAERLQVISDLYALYSTSSEQGDKKLLLFLIAHFCKPFAELTGADIREATLMGKLTKPSAAEENDKALTDLLAAKKLFEQLPNVLAQ